MTRLCTDAKSSLLSPSFAESLCWGMVTEYQIRRVTSVAAILVPHIESVM